MPFFEPLEKLDPKHIDLERARKSLREELEAIDFYQERIDATDDASLKHLLEHNNCYLLSWFPRWTQAVPFSFQCHPFSC